MRISQNSSVWMSHMELLAKIAPTLEFDEADEVKPFDWKRPARRFGTYPISTPIPEQHGRCCCGAAKGRQSSRLASAGSHAKFIETPDSEKTEGAMTRKYAINHPILFLLRQEGKKENGWRGHVVLLADRTAQANTPPVIYTSESIE